MENNANDVLQHLELIVPQCSNSCSRNRDLEVIATYLKTNMTKLTIEYVFKRSIIDINFWILLSTYVTKETFAIFQTSIVYRL